MDKDKQTIEIKVNWGQLFSLIWMLGYFFTAGYTNIPTSGFWEQILLIITLILGWPIVLGLKLGGHI